MLKVVKFGGSSLASAHQFRKVKAIVDADSSRRFVVPSAPGKRDDGDTKVTDLLYTYYDLAKTGRDCSAVREEIRSRFEQIVRELGLRFDLEKELEKIDGNFEKGYGRDYAASRGEYLNGRIMAEYLGFRFIDAAKVVCFDAAGNFLPEETNEALQKHLSGVSRAVIPGFYGAMPDGTIKTFSRGGSDITGALVSRAVHAELYENWTDVSGFLLADPRIVNNPVPIGTITYEELHALSSMGASVLHEDAIFPVIKEGIPIQIKNTNRPEDSGTMIVTRTSQKPSYRITGIAGKRGLCAMNIHMARVNGAQDLDRKVAEVLKNKQVPFEQILLERDTVSVLVQEKKFRAKEQSVLSGIRRSVHPDSISLEADIAVVAVGRRGHNNIGGCVFSALENANIHARTIEQGEEEQTMLVGVRDEDFESAIRAIYDGFIKRNRLPAGKV